MGSGLQQGTVWPDTLPEMLLLLGAPDVFDKRFFGAAFNLDNVRSFKPDITIDRPCVRSIAVRT